MFFVPNLPDACPLDVDEIAEAFAMKTLPAADALKFAIHHLSCRQCAAAADEAKQFVRDIKVAAERLMAEPGAISRKLWKRALLTRAGPKFIGETCPQMRFYVTGYEPPPTRR